MQDAISRFANPGPYDPDPYSHLRSNSVDSPLIHPTPTSRAACDKCGLTAIDITIIVLGILIGTVGGGLLGALNDTPIGGAFLGGCGGLAIGTIVTLRNIYVRENGDVENPSLREIAELTEAITRRSIPPCE